MKTRIYWCISNQIYTYEINVESTMIHFKDRLVDIVKQHADGNWLTGMM